MVEIATSMLSVKEEEPVKIIYNLEVAHTDYFHIDVMDGKFVEDDTQERMLKYAKMIKQISNLPLDVHLMVEDVERNIEEYLPLEPRIITFHLEVAKNKEEIKSWIKKIKEDNCKVGISIKPETAVDQLYEFLPYIHVVLIMTVEPGKGGQKLIPETLEKVKKLYEYRRENNLEFEIEVDGGINTTTIEEVRNSGVDIAVAGTAVIQATDYKKVIQELKG